MMITFKREIMFTYYTNKIHFYNLNFLRERTI